MLGYQYQPAKLADTENSVTDLGINKHKQNHKHFWEKHQSLRPENLFRSQQKWFTGGTGIDI